MQTGMLQILTSPGSAALTCGTPILPGAGDCLMRSFTDIGATLALTTTGPAAAEASALGVTTTATVPSAATDSCRSISLATVASAAVLLLAAAAAFGDVTAFGAAAAFGASGTSGEATARGVGAAGEGGPGEEAVSDLALRGDLLRCGDRERNTPARPSIRLPLCWVATEGLGVAAADGTWQEENDGVVT